MRLAFGELEALASAFLTVLLSLMRARIARQKSELLQFPAQFGIELDQCTGNPKPSCPGLSANPAAIGEDHNVKLICHFNRQQWLADVRASRFTDEIILKRPVIYGDFAVSGPQKYTSRRRLAASGC